MTEKEWLASTEPDDLLVFLDVKASDRKMRLFCCACVRRVWYRLGHAEASRRAVEVAEEVADGQKPEQELAGTSNEAERAIQIASQSEEKNALRAAAWCVSGKIDALSITRSVAWGAAYASRDAMDSERSAQAQLLRDVFGNPFQPPSVEAIHLTPTVRATAAAVYQERTLPAGNLDLERLAVLADALEDGGCRDSRILSHCREVGPHVRGCWVVDLVLGKK
jgi:hypothetical protein